MVTAVVRGGSTSLKTAIIRYAPCAFGLAVESVMPAPPYGSHHCMRARRPRSQAVQGRVLLWRARNMPERPWAALACILIIKI